MAELVATLMICSVGALMIVLFVWAAWALFTLPTDEMSSAVVRRIRLYALSALAVAHWIYFQIFTTLMWGGGAATGAVSGGNYYLGKDHVRVSSVVYYLVWIWGWIAIVLAFGLFVVLAAMTIFNRGATDRFAILGDTDLDDGGDRSLEPDGSSRRRANSHRIAE
ncbi:MAG: hypothetical protein AAF078_01615 [Planctomycetota bacterium]